MCYHKGRVYTEEKANVVAAAWGTELLQFLATLVYFAPGRLEEFDEINKSYDKKTISTVIKSKCES